MKTTILKNLKKGDFFRRIINGKECAKTYIKGYYDKSAKAFCCTNYDDINDYIFIKADKIVSYDFTF